MATAPITHQDLPAAKSALPRLPSAWLIVTPLVAAAFFPLLWIHFGQLWVRPHYQFFPFVLVGAVLLAWTRLRQVACLRPGSARWSWCFLGGLWLVLATAEVLNSSWLGAVALMLLAWAVLYTLGGSSLVRALLPAWIFLCLIIPPPFGLDNAVVLTLQRLTTRWSSALLDHFGIFHVLAGNVMEIGGRRFFVDEACAGINSLFSILACTVFYVFMARVPVFRASALVASSVAWVLLANVARVFLVAFLARRYDINVADGWRHDALGVSLFSCALGLIWSTDRLLVFLTTRRNPIVTNRPDLSNAKTNPAAEFEVGVLARTLSNSWLGSWVTATAFAGLLTLHLAAYGLPTLAAQPTAIAAADLDADALPKDLLGWRRERFADDRRNPGSAYGEFSKTWFYQADSASAIFSLDYPFSGFHELTLCYNNQGWELVDRSQQTGTSNGAPATFYQAAFKKSGRRGGYLFFCEFDQTGQVIAGERGGVVSTLTRHESALKRWRVWMGQEPASTEPRQAGSLYQFQLFIESNAPLTGAELEKSTTRFIEGFKAVQHKMFLAKQ